MTPLDRRLQLLNAGYSPLPLNGKAPVLANWPTRAITNVDEIQLWSRTFPGAGTGILTRLTPTLDIDVLDSEAAEAIEQLVRDRFGEFGSVLPRFGQAPKRAILFRTDRPFPKIAVNVIAGNGSAQKVEFLCDGQQVVVDGIHPTTRQRYRWPSGCIGDIRHDDLPLIDASEARQLIDDIVELLTAEYGYRSQETKPKGGGNGGDPTDWGDFANLIDHDVLAAFAMKLLKSGMHPGAAVNLLKARIAQLKGVDPARKQRRLDEVVDIVTSAEAKLEGDARPPLCFIDMTQWTTDNAPSREWAVEDRIPLRQPTLFSGEGAVGKSLIELHLCAAHVLGRDWLGTAPVQGPVVYLGAEDEDSELQRRLADIARHYGVGFGDLISGGLHLLSLAGEDALLGVPDRGGKIVPTALFTRMLEAAGDIKPKHIGIDTSADVFGGNENDRAQVRQFVGLLRKLAMTAGGAVVLLSHPSLTGINSGSGLSGSTGWHNSVRARMYLHSTTSAEGEQPDSDLREIEFKKNNYGPKGHSIVLRWRNGLFLPEPSMSSLEKAQRDQRIDEVFLACLRKREELNWPVMPGNTSRDYAPKVFAEMAEGKAYLAKDYERAMGRLLERRLIHIGFDGKRSRPQKILRSGPPPSEREEP